MVALAGWLSSTAWAQGEAPDRLGLDSTEAVRSELERTAALSDDAAADGRIRVALLHRRAVARTSLGRYAAAAEDLRRVLALNPPSRGEGNDWGVRWRVDNDLVFLLLESGDLLGALEHQKARPFAPSQATAVATGLGHIQLQLGLLDDVERTLQGGLRTLQDFKRQAALRQPYGEALASVLELAWASHLDRMGARLLEQRGQVPQAEGLHQLALARARDGMQRAQSLDEQQAWRTRLMPGVLVSAQIALASNLVAQGRLAEAEVAIADGLTDLLRRADLRNALVGQAVSLLGQLRLQQGRLDDAERLFQAALTSSEAAEFVPHAPTLAEHRAWLGTVRVAQGRNAEALPLFERRAAPLAAGADHIDWALALLRQGQADRALAMLQRAADDQRRKPLPDALLLAQAQGFGALALVQRGDRVVALREFSLAMPLLMAQAQNMLRNDAEAYLQQWRLRVIAEGYLALLATCADGCGSSGLDVVAESFRVAEAVRGSQVQRAMSTGLARARLPDARLQALARDEQALEARSRSLRELRQRLLLAPPEQRLNQVIEAMQRDVARLDAEWRAVRAQIVRGFPAYAELTRPNPTTLRQTQEQLATDEALVAIYQADTQVFVWTVTPSAADFRLVASTRAELAALVGRVRAQLQFGDSAPPAFDATAAAALYSALLLPGRPMWSDARLLHVVPHGDLAQVPFSLLVTATATTTATATVATPGGRPAWLIEDIAIAQLPTVAALTSLRRGAPAAQAKRAFVGFGDPVFAAAPAASTGPSGVRNLPAPKVGAGLPQTVAGPAAGFSLEALATLSPQALSQAFAGMPALPETADELREMALSLGADAARDLHLGLQASERVVKSLDLSDYNVVAFATHGLLAGEIDGLDQPALVLSNPLLTREAEDGLLTMGEVLGLRLNAAWVVLSACNTASSDGRASEALSGLGQAFFFAGARSLLVSSWPVETVSAQRLTTGAFRAQAEDRVLGRAEALRRSMRALLEQSRFAHPIYWAPFTLVGDGAGR